MRGNKSSVQKLRNFSQMTKVLSDENAKHFATFFRPRPPKMIINFFLKVNEKANKWLKNSKNIKKHSVNRACLLPLKLGRFFRALRGFLGESALSTLKVESAEG